MKSLRIILFFIALFLWSCSGNINLYKNGMPHGRWKYKTSEQDYSKGRYSLGKAVGKWKTVVDGKLYRKFRHKNNTEIIKTYYPNGVLKSKGMAKTDITVKIHNDTLAEEVHWYYTGKWYQYGPDRKLLRIETYKNGEWIDDPDSEEQLNKPIQ